MALNKILARALMAPADDLDGEPVELETVTAMADRTVAESFLKRRKLDIESAPQHVMAATAWTALTRVKLLEEMEFDVFLARCLDTELTAAGTVDPTQRAASSEAASTSPSPQPEASATTG